MERQFLILPDSDLAYIFSTFQATHLYTFESMKSLPRFMKYNVSQTVPKCVCNVDSFQNDIVIDGKQNDLNFCTGDCSCKWNQLTYCVLELQTKNQHVNVTFHNIEYNGPNIDNCR